MTALFLHVQCLHVIHSPGTNTGDHMYVRASDACNQLALTQPNPNDGHTAAWSIRIDQVNEAEVTRSSDARS